MTTEIATMHPDCIYKVVTALDHVNSVCVNSVCANTKTKFYSPVNVFVMKQVAFYASYRGQFVEDPFPPPPMATVAVTESGER